MTQAEQFEGALDPDHLWTAVRAQFPGIPAHARVRFWIEETTDNNDSGLPMDLGSGGFYASVRFSATWER